MDIQICAIFNLPPIYGPVLAIYENCEVATMIKMLSSYEIEDDMIELAEIKFLGESEKDRDVMVRPFSIIELKDIAVEDLYKKGVLKDFLNSMYYEYISKEPEKVLH